MTNDLIENLGSHISKEILKQPGRKIKADDPLITGGLIDSFHLVDLALFIEENFGVRIDDTELTADTFNTLSELETLILQRMA